MELFPSRKPSTKRPLEHSEATTEEAQLSKRRSLTTTCVRRTYNRQPKPPYTYLGMITVAIHSSPNKRLTLLEIQDALREMFPFFKGEYTGWRDSVRHFLSSSPCFTKISRNNATKNSKGNHWAVDLSLVPADAFKRLKVKPEMKSTWAPTLTQQLEIPDIVLPSPRTPPKKLLRVPKTTSTAPKASSATTALGFSDSLQYLSVAPSLSYTEAQYTRYLREQTPGTPAVPLSQYPPFASLLFQATTSSDYTEAAANLNRLCPEPDYGSPTPAPREWSTQPSTPRVRQTLNFITPYPATTHSFSRHPDNTEPSEIASFFMNFGKSLSESTDANECVDLKKQSANSHQLQTAEYHHFATVSTQSHCQMSPVIVKQEQTTDHQIMATPDHPSSVTSSNQLEQVVEERTLKDRDEIPVGVPLPVLSFDDLANSPEGAFNHF